jgi:hypothetical protein
MQLPTTSPGILLVLGAVFLLIAVVGGGFEVSALKVPPLGKYQRVFALLAGIVLIMLGTRPQTATEGSGAKLAGANTAPEPAPAKPADRPETTTARPSGGTQRPAPAIPRPAPQPRPADLCLKLEGKALSINANNYEGLMGPSGIALTPDPHLGYKFTTVVVFVGEQANAVTGVCEKGHIDFQRVLVDSVTVQRYSGVISPLGVEVHGRFSHKSPSQDYSWSGQIVEPRR